MNQQLLKEYNILRNDVGLISFSSIAKFFIAGDDSLAFLNKLVGIDVEIIEEGKFANTLFMNEDASIIAIVWLVLEEGHYIILVDEKKRDSLFQWLIKHSKEYNVKIEDKTDMLECLSVIGPKAQEITRAIAGDDIVGLPYLGFEHNTVLDCLLCRIGDTGEYEYRFILEKDRCNSLKEKILETGKEYNLSECTLVTLDLLMLEMKSINQNIDLLEDSTPIQAGLHWMLDFHKDVFVGKDVVEAEKKSVSRRLLTLMIDAGEKIPPGAKLYIDDNIVGLIVNTNFSPTLNKDIALGYIEERVGWVGIDFLVETITQEKRNAKTVSSPLFLTKTVQEASG